MANRPDHSRGFIPHGYEWDAAVVSAPLTHLERLVWLEVTFQWLGFARRPVVVLSPTRIAERCRTSRGNVGTAIDGLVRKRMLRKLAGGYEPEGDPAEWDFGEPPAKRAGRLAYIAESFAHVRDIRPLEPRPTGPTLEPATQQLSFLGERPGDPARPEPTPATPDRRPDRSAIAEQSVLPQQNKRSAIAEQSVLPYQNKKCCAIEERARVQIKKDLKIFLDAEPDDSGGAIKKIFASGGESPEELAALTIAMHEQRGTTDDFHRG